MSRRAMNPSTTAAMPTGIDRKNEKNKQAISETTPTMPQMRAAIALPLVFCGGAYP